MAERKSAAREAQITIDESARTRRERLQLFGILLAVPAIISLMFVIAGFLSNKGGDEPWLMVGIFGVTAVLSAVCIFLARRTKVTA